MTGFTLVELMIVIAIFGILFSMASPSIATMFVNREADTLLAELEVDIQFARNQAISNTDSQVGEIVSITPISNDWSIGWKISQGASTLRQRGSLANPRTATGNITSSTYSQGAPLRFDLYGHALQAGRFSIAVPGCTGDREADLLIQSLGQVLISRGPCQ
jgi:type IV fimbrial biogenesis protein FimT